MHYNINIECANAPRNVELIGDERKDKSERKTRRNWANARTSCGKSQYFHQDLQDVRIGRANPESRRSNLDSQSIEKYSGKTFWTSITQTIEKGNEIITNRME